MYVADFFINVSGIEWVFVACKSQEKLVVAARYSGTRGHAGKFVDHLFSATGSAGGHKSMASAEIPITNIDADEPDLPERNLEHGEFVDHVFYCLVMDFA